MNAFLSDCKTKNTGLAGSSGTPAALQCNHAETPFMAPG